MRVLLQRVSEASVKIEERVVGQIESGLLLLVGIEEEDSKNDADWLIKKIIGMRIFSDEEGRMNRSIQDIAGQFLVVSQFTLHASTKKGNRPSFIKAARPEQAIPLYEYFKEELRKQSNLIVETGQFGADMKVSLTNDGPVTIWLDSKNKE
ncbi:MAG: D-aminoacyl-tRNA deacylase [Crocinitomicaceae bacterium]